MTESNLQRDEEGNRIILGMKFPSVTTILKSDPQYSVDYSKIPKHILEKASTRGNFVHEAMEKVLKGEEYEIPKEYYHLFVNLIAQMNSHISQNYTNLRNAVCEKTIYHSSLKYSGQLDYTCAFNRKTIQNHKTCRLIVDYKTSSQKMESHEIQVAAYALADFNMRHVGDDGTVDHLKGTNVVVQTLVNAHGERVNVAFPDFDRMSGLVIYSHHKNTGIVEISGRKLKTRTYDFLDILEDFGRKHGESLR